MAAEKDSREDCIAEEIISNKTRKTSSSKVIDNAKSGYALVYLELFDEMGPKHNRRYRKAQ